MVTTAGTKTDSLSLYVQASCMRGKWLECFDRLEQASEVEIRSYFGVDCVFCSIFYGYETRRLQQLVQNQTASYYMCKLAACVVSGWSASTGWREHQKSRSDRISVLTVCFVRRFIDMKIDGYNSWYKNRQPLTICAS